MAKKSPKPKSRAKWRRRMLGALVLVAIGAFYFTSCCALPKVPPGSASRTIDNPEGTAFARAIAPEIQRHSDQSGMYVITEGQDGFLARLALMRVAERSLDLQYYIWHDDFTGRLAMLSALQAADRGVRVRMLLDDLGAHPDDNTLLALSAHPNIEVRLHNPAVHRTLRFLDMIGNFSRYNHRMHNKTFIADGSAVIVGGRNIGDEYFEAAAEVNFNDLDVLCIGPVVPQTSAAFDAYWNNKRSIPIELFYPKRDSTAALADLRKTLAEITGTPREQQYVKGIEAAALELQMRRGTLPLQWGFAKALYDDPDKHEAPVEGQSVGPTLAQLLVPYAKDANDELLIISPYFVPGKTGVKWLGQFTARGTKVSIITNSLASNDVAAVHAGYAHYRKDMLKDGVSLYEMRPSASKGNAKAGEGPKWFGSSQASLHAKSFVYGRRAVFIGTLNLDPRSVVLNTENGIIMENEPLAAQLAQSFDQAVGSAVYTVGVDPQKKTLRWTDPSTGKVYTGEPECGKWRRFCAWFVSLFPIESQL